VQTLLDERHAYVRALMNDKRELLDRVAAALLKEETLDQSELLEIFGPRLDESGHPITTATIAGLRNQDSAIAKLANESGTSNFS
jgi:hypothetical protein